MSRNEAIVRLLVGLFVGALLGLMYNFASGRMQDIALNIISVITLVAIVVAILRISTSVMIIGATILVMVTVGLGLTGTLEIFGAALVAVIKTLLLTLVAFLGGSIIAWMIFGVALTLLVGALGILFD